MSATVNRRVTVHVNDTPRQFFLGLSVRHAIGYQQARRVELGEAVVKDGDGNLVDLDGALYDGERLYVRPAPGPMDSQSGSGSGPGWR